MTLFVAILGGYLGAGVLVALVWIFVFLPKFEAAAGTGSWLFRLAVFPGGVLLWPVIVAKSLRTHFGDPVAGGVEGPVSAEGVRRRHGRSAIWMLFAGPVVFVVALIWRPAVPPNASIVNPSQPTGAQSR
jgi:hypothetical protein